jgi:hypothetical protein
MQASTLRQTRPSDRQIHRISTKELYTFKIIQKANAVHFELHTHTSRQKNSLRLEEEHRFEVSETKKTDNVWNKD